MSNVAAAVEPEGIARETVGRWLAYGGIAAGVVAFWVALPPVTTRSPVVPLLIGLVGVATGAAAIYFGAGRRLGGIAIAVGILGILLGGLATRSGVEALDTVFVWSALIAATLRAATPLTLAALGGILSERAAS